MRVPTFARPFSALLAAALVAAVLPAAAAAALPRSYNALRIDSPSPVAGGAFGWGL